MWWSFHREVGGQLRVKRLNEWAPLVDLGSLKFLWVSESEFWLEKMFPTGFRSKVCPQVWSPVYPSWSGRLTGSTSDLVMTPVFDVAGTILDGGKRSSVTTSWLLLNAGHLQPGTSSPTRRREKEEEEEQIPFKRFPSSSSSKSPAIRAVLQQGLMGDYPGVEIRLADLDSPPSSSLYSGTSVSEFLIISALYFHESVRSCRMWFVQRLWLCPFNSILWTSGTFYSECVCCLISGELIKQFFMRSW